MIRFVFLVMLAVAAIGTSLAQWNQPMLMSGGVVGPVPVAITPTAATVPDNSTAGTVIASFVVTTSPASTFNGTITDSDSSGLTVMSNYNMIVATNLSSANDGTYTPQICATENGTSKCITFTLTISNSGGLQPPAPAVNAGLTTLLANWDFQGGQICTYDGRSPACVNATPTSNWFDCGGGDTTKLFHNTWFLTLSPSAVQSFCNVAIGNDPSTSTQALILKYLKSYSSQGLTGGADLTSISTATSGSTITFTHPVASYYIEAQYRFDTGIDPGFIGPQIWWESTYSPSGQCAMDLQLAELYAQPGGGGADGSMGICNGAFGDAVKWSGGCCSGGGNSLPPGWASTSYFTYAGMQTTDGTSSILSCLFVSNILQKGLGGDSVASCNERFHDSTQLTQVPWIVNWVGSYANGGFTYPAEDVALYTRFVHVWSCAASARDANNNCRGSTKTGSQSNLWYWH